MYITLSRYPIGKKKGILFLSGISFSWRISLSTFSWVYSKESLHHRCHMQERGRDWAWYLSVCKVSEDYFIKCYSWVFKVLRPIFCDVPPLKFPALEMGLGSVKRHWLWHIHELILTPLSPAQLRVCEKLTRLSLQQRENKNTE